MTKETVQKANQIVSEIEKAKQQIINLHALDELSSTYEGETNKIPIGGIKINIPAKKEYVIVPKELKQPVLNLLHGYWQGKIDSLEEELEIL